MRPRGAATGMSWTWLARAAGLAAQRREENERQAYDRDRRQEGENLFKALPAKEQAAIEQLAAERSASFDGALRDQMIAFNRIRFTIERHESEITSYQEWKSHRHTMPARGF